MPNSEVFCDKCAQLIGYSEPYCRCGHFMGFPNHRRAKLELNELEDRYQNAYHGSIDRGATSQITKLNEIADNCLPVINMDVEACDDILRAKKYLNYHRRLGSGARDPAKEKDHANRAKVGEVLFPAFSDKIHYAVMSPNGKGLSNYGAIAVQWQVTAEYLEPRASLLESNSFFFYEDHGLGDLDAEVPYGFQAIWKNRATLALAKLGPKLDKSTSEAELEILIMSVGKDRRQDDYIEIAIYAQNGLDTLDIDKITCERAPATPDENHRWQIIKESCVSRVPEIEVVY